MAVLNMNKQNVNNISGDNVAPLSVFAANDSCRKKAKYLVLYLVYVGIVLMAGIKFRVFHGEATSSSAGTPPLQNSSVASPETHGQISPLPQGILVFDEETKQTTVQEGEAQAYFAFNLCNASKQPVVIKKVETSCGCTVAKVQQLPWVLKPKEKGQISVTMNVPGHIDKRSKDVTIYTDQGYKPLKVVAIIAPINKPH
jgi:hypothetical protein